MRQNPGQQFQQQVQQQQQRQRQAGGAWYQQKRREAEAAKLQRNRRLGAQHADWSVDQQVVPSQGYLGSDGHPLRAIIVLPFLLAAVAVVAFVVGTVAYDNFGIDDTGSAIAAGAVLLVGIVWALRRTVRTWQGD